MTALSIGGYDVCDLYELFTLHAKLVSCPLEFVRYV